MAGAVRVLHHHLRYFRVSRGLCQNALKVPPLAPSWYQQAGAIFPEVRIGSAKPHCGTHIRYVSCRTDHYLPHRHSDRTWRHPSASAFDSASAIHHQEIIMNKDQVKGRIKEAQGKVKEVTGKAVGNKNLEQKGKVQQTVGKVQAGYGDLKNDIKKAV